MEQENFVNGRCKVQPTNGFVEFSKEETEQSIPDRFEKIAARYPNSLAIKAKNVTRDYAELNKTANRVARAILGLRGDAQEPVAIFLNHDAAMIASILGVLKAGKICVPLDPSYPQERVTYILQDSQAQLIVTDKKNFPMARTLAQQTYQLLNIEELDTSLSVNNLGLLITPDTLAYILYTSGSTGRPKGVIHNHRNVLHNAMRYSNGCHIGEEDRVTLFASLGTGQGTPTAFSALLNGATLYPFNIREEGMASLAEWLIMEKITVYISAPTVFRHFVATLTGKEQFPKLRVIRLGAEQVRKSDVDLYTKYFSADSVLAIFLSATEVGNFSQYFIDKETEIAGNIVPVGYAVQDMEILLLDDTDREVGVSEVGEIAVKSRYLSPGYWRNPDLTDAAFKSDLAGGSTRIYRTGDLGRKRPDGCLEHLGRKGLQVKIRGFRVELEEVETILRLHPAVRESIVEARTDESENLRLVAYMIFHQDQTLTTTTELSTYLRTKLPDYMVPSAFVILDSLPLTPTGKIDRRALPQPDKAAHDSNVPFVAARSPVEREITDVWCEILGLERVGIYDNFFNLGGHSISATQIVVRLQRIFHLDLPLATLLVNPTVAGMAEVIETIRWTRQGQQDSTDTDEREQGDL
jgi:amino acid adenylation domain-containing protein